MSEQSSRRRVVTVIAGVLVVVLLAIGASLTIYAINGTTHGSAAFGTALETGRMLLIAGVVVGLAVALTRLLTARGRRSDKPGGIGDPTRQ